MIKALKEFFTRQGKRSQDKSVQSEKTIVKEIEVLVPIPINFERVGGEWDRFNAENLNTFLSSNTGLLFQQLLMLKYGTILQGIASNEARSAAECAVAAKGFYNAIGMMRQLSNPAAYSSTEVETLSRANSRWGAGLAVK